MKRQNNALRKESLHETGARLVELDPKSAEVYRQRGDTKAKSKDYAGAIEDYTQAIELDPKNVECLFQPGICQERSSGTMREL